MTSIDESAKDVLVVVAGNGQSWAPATEQWRRSAREVLVIVQRHDESGGALALRVADRIAALRRAGHVVDSAVWLPLAASSRESEPVSRSGSSLCAPSPAQLHARRTSVRVNEARR